MMKNPRYSPRKRILFFLAGITVAIAVLGTRAALGDAASIIALFVLLLVTALGYRVYSNHIGNPEEK